MNTTIAYRTLWPTNSLIALRAVFLYVGQGSSTLFLGKSASGGYETVLVDINLDPATGGIDVPRLMGDLLGDQSLAAFINTHPHDDHLRGIKELADAVSIASVGHSNHRPSKKYGERYEDLVEVTKGVKKQGGKEFYLTSDAKSYTLGGAEFCMLHPTEALTDEVNEEKADERYARIHEQCGVVKFGAHGKWVIVPGDADRAAFEGYIVRNHAPRLKADVLAASHHGSMSFFKRDKNNAEEKSCLVALQAIAPKAVVISAPKQDESRHNHPDDEAVKLYEDQVGAGNVHHTGAERHCFVYDIYSNGTDTGVQTDNGTLSEEYALPEPDGDGSDGTKSEGRGPFIKTVPAAAPTAPSRYG